MKPERVVWMVLMSLIAAKVTALTTVTLSAAIAPGRPAPHVCVAHVVNGNAEQTAPCGNSLALKGGRSLGWLEADGLMTPYLTDVSDGGTMSLEASVPSGEVTIDPRFGLARGDSLIVFSLLPAPKGRFAFERIALPQERPASIKVPAGRVIAMLYDAHGGAVGISKPTVVPSEGGVAILPDSPGNGADVLALLARPPAEELAAVTVAITDKAGSHVPDVIVDGYDRLLAAWYGVQGGELKLAARSESLYLPPGIVQVRPREVVIVRDSLKPLPKLTVGIGSLPESQRNKPAAMTLSVYTAGEKAALRDLSVKAGETYALGRMQPASLDVVLAVSGFRISRHADLTSGADVRIDIELEPIVVSGTVYYGNDPARAELHVLQRGEPLLAQTDDRGAYTFTVWAKGRFFVDTSLFEHVDTPPFREVVNIEDSRTYDVHIPAVKLAARVFDRGDMTPIPGASLILQSTYLDPETNRNSNSSIQLQTSSTPLTALPPLHLGQAELRARASGYEDAGPISFVIDTSTSEQVVDVPMKRVSEVKPLRVTMPDGSPAVNAEVATASSSMTITWRGVASSEGVVQIPKSLAGSHLLIRHPDASSVIAQLPPDPEAELATINLSVAAPPLTVRFVESDGTPIKPAPPAFIAVWTSAFQGIQLTGPLLSFLTWSSGSTMSDGTWTAKNIPAGFSIRIVASRRGGLTALRAGNFDGLASTVPFPWAPAVTLRPVD